MTLDRQTVAAIVEKHHLRFFGITDLTAPESFPKFEQWLKDHKHAGMHFLTEHQQIRKNPQELLFGAKSAVILGMEYYLGPENYRSYSAPAIAQYARFKDYHNTLRQRGEAILGELLETSGHGVQKHPHVGRVCVDTAPLLEKPLAARTEKGFIGKNTLYIHPELGSYLFLAEILTTLELPVDEKVAVDPDQRTDLGGCGTCQRCQIHCPTGALDEAYQLDANKCLAYWTIEHRGIIPLKYWPWLKYFVFGCDICQQVCPYNRDKNAVSSLATAVPKTPPLDEMALMDHAYYVRVFGGTALTRAKREGLRRNAFIAMVVTGHKRVEEIARIFSQDESLTLRETAAQLLDYAPTVI
jgi:epoxyqueuosine reductase